MAKKSQRDKFKEAARALKTDNSAKRFDEKLGKIAKKKQAGLGPQSPRTKVK